jgi:hypothetical protein
MTFEGDNSVVVVVLRTRRKIEWHLTNLPCLSKLTCAVPILDRSTAAQN